MVDIVNVVTYQNGQIYKQVLLDLIPRARNSIKVATANIRDFGVKIFEDSFPLSDYMKYFAKKGVSVKILATPNSCKSIFFRKVLETPNLEVRACARNHLKLVIVDTKRAYVGTANLTSSGLGPRPINIRNFEIGFITESKSVVSAVNKIFEDIWNWRPCNSCLYKDRTDLKCTKKLDFQKGKSW